VTESVARAASPRRTVRVAVALVTGQVALCGVIGWVTFGSPDPAPPSAGRQVAPAAGPPIVMPTAGMGLPFSAAPRVTTSAVRSRPEASTRASKPPRPATTSRARATTPAVPSPLAAPQRSTGPATPPPGANPARTPMPTPSGVQEGVVTGEPCDPPGAVGRTKDGVKVRCERVGDVPSWQQIN
jgi:hypothetical protein